MVFKNLLSRFVYLLSFQLGLLQPNIDFTSIEPTIRETTTTTINNLINPMTRLFQIGQQITRNNPVFGNFLGHYLSYLYITFLILFGSYIVQGILRHCIHLIYKETRRLRK